MFRRTVRKIQFVRYEVTSRRNGPWGSKKAIFFNTEARTTEEFSPHVLFANSLSLTMTLSVAVPTFGFELEPNEWKLFDYTAEFYSNGGSVLESSVSRKVHGKDGARLFAATSTGSPIDKVIVSGGDVFAIARIRYGAAAANAAPTAHAGADQIVECTAAGEASVTLNASGSSDSDGDGLTYTWKEGETELGMTTDPTAQLTVSLPLGSHTITLTVDDGNGGTASDEVVIDVVDTTAPTVTAELVPVGDDDDEFRVEFSCADGCDAGPVSSAEINGIAVSNGQIVELEIDDDNEVEWDDGMLSIEAPAITLTVTCTDVSGNVTVVEVQLPDDDKSDKSGKSGKSGWDEADAEDDDRRWSITDWWRRWRSR